jgi:hypothetical protein
MRTTGKAVRTTMCALSALAALNVSACSQNPAQGPGPNMSSTESLHRTLVERAKRDYNYDDPSLPVRNDPLDISSHDSVRNIHVLSVRMTPRHVAVPEAPRFLFAILSTRDYPRLGIRSGINFVLKLKRYRGRDTTAYAMVPGLKDAPMYFLRSIVIHETSHEPAPHLILKPIADARNGDPFLTTYAVIGGCIDNCGSGHCAVSDLGVQLTASSADGWQLQ